jgi:hypothetical protein
MWTEWGASQLPRGARGLVTSALLPRVRDEEPCQPAPLAPVLGSSPFDESTSSRRLEKLFLLHHHILFLLPPSSPSLWTGLLCLALDSPPGSARLPTSLPPLPTSHQYQYQYQFFLPSLHGPAHLELSRFIFGPGSAVTISCRADSRHRRRSLPPAERKEAAS